MRGRSIAGSRQFVHNVAPSPEREEFDFYPTPPEATISLLAMEQFGRRIWEPACGDGAISKVLEERGHDVVSSDLIDRGYGEGRVDFLMESAPGPEEIDLITNPPFVLAEQFLHHALKVGVNKVALMLRLAWLEGERRKRLIYDTCPPVRVHVSSRRVTMLRGGVDGGKGGGGMIAFAWFIWERGFTGKTELDFFDWADHAPEIYAAQRKREKPPPTTEPMPLFE